MIKIELQRDVALLRGQMAALYEMFNENKNIQSGDRVKDLAVKLQKQEYSIAFCGHFSAGKSSMINTLMGENILPSSPIPTSANLVKIKSGEDYAKVYFKEDTLNFKDSKGKISEFWVKYFAAYNMKVPQGKAGSHPTGVFWDDIIKVRNKLDTNKDIKFEKGF